MKWRFFCVLVASVAALLAQTPRETILTIEADKTVFYWDDVGDPTLNGRSATMPTRASVANFQPALLVSDIMAVNGTPAKGVFVGRGISTILRPFATGSQGISDVSRNNVFDFHIEIQQANGTPIGSLVLGGLGGGHPPLGAPTGAAAGNFAVLGGTGAFLGARGQGATVSVVARSASITENPVFRQIYPGAGAFKFVVHLIPMTWPEVLVFSTGPAVYHAQDWSLVTATKPAQAGEWLIMAVSGLGPTKPSVDPGNPFPRSSEPPCLVNSPVEVTMNGKATQTANSIGWPETQGIYRTDFLVPAGTAPGLAAVGISAAWINGPEVKIPVR